MAGAGALLLSLVLVGVGDPSIFDAPAPAGTTSAVSVSASDSDSPRPKVRDESAYPPVLNRELDFGDARSPAVIVATGIALKDLGRAIVDGRSNVAADIETITFIVYAGPNGHGFRKLLHFSIDVTDLKRLTGHHGSGWQFLQAAHDAGAWTPENDDVVSAYCAARSRFDLIIAV